MNIDRRLNYLAAGDNRILSLESDRRPAEIDSWTEETDRRTARDVQEDSRDRQ